MSSVILAVELKDTNVKSFFRDVNRELDKLEKKGSDAFDEIDRGFALIGGSAKVSGVQIGQAIGKFL